jgi:hypothetical protein
LIICDDQRCSTLNIWTLCINHIAQLDNYQAVCSFRTK